MLFQNNVLGSPYMANSLYPLFERGRRERRTDGGTRASVNWETRKDTGGPVLFSMEYIFQHGDSR